MDRINLDEAGVAVYRCQLWLDDYLWFASSDISAVSTTEGVVHNYALAYALNRFDRAFGVGDVPTYAEDLAAMEVYPTPAAASNTRRTSLTFNAIDTATQQTESPGVRRRITPKIGTPLDPQTWRCRTLSASAKREARRTLMWSRWKGQPRNTGRRHPSTTL